MNVTAAHLSIILEIVAFFLVTLELYGEQRLRLTATVMKTLFEVVRRRAEAGINFMFGAGALAFSILLLVGMFLDDRDTQNPSLLTSIVVVGGTGLVLLSLAAIALLCLAWLAMTFGLFLFSKVHFRGLMLFGGAMLFIVSKALVW